MKLRLCGTGVSLALIVTAVAPETALAQMTVRSNSGYSYDMLDPTTNINRKQLLLLDNRRREEIPDDSVIFGAAVTGLVDFHKRVRRRNVCKLKKAES